MSITTVTTYTCSDGTVFHDSWKATEHESTIDVKSWANAHGLSNLKAAKWLRTSYFGRELLTKHSLDEEGIWRIRGEDSNCDMGGPHHMPSIDTVEGKLIDAIEYAVNHSRFFTWGSGGDITKVEIKKIKKV